MVDSDDDDIIDLLELDRLESAVRASRKLNACQENTLYPKNIGLNYSCRGFSSGAQPGGAIPPKNVCNNSMRQCSTSLSNNSTINHQGNIDLRQKHSQINQLGQGKENRQPFGSQCTIVPQRLQHSHQSTTHSRQENCQTRQHDCAAPQNIPSNQKQFKPHQQCSEQWLLQQSSTNILDSRKVLSELNTPHCHQSNNKVNQQLRYTYDATYCQAPLACGANNDQQQDQQSKKPNPLSCGHIQRSRTHSVKSVNQHPCQESSQIVSDCQLHNNQFPNQAFDYLKSEVQGLQQGQIHLGFRDSESARYAGALNTSVKPSNVKGSLTSNLPNQCTTQFNPTSNISARITPSSVSKANIPSTAGMVSLQASSGTMARGGVRGKGLQRGTFVRNKSIPYASQRTSQTKLDKFMVKNKGDVYYGRANKFGNTCNMDNRRGDSVIYVDSSGDECEIIDRLQAYDQSIQALKHSTAIQKEQQPQVVGECDRQCSTGKHGLKVAQTSGQRQQMGFIDEQGKANTVQWQTEQCQEQEQLGQGLLGHAGNQQQVVGRLYEGSNRVESGMEGVVLGQSCVPLELGQQPGSALITRKSQCPQPDARQGLDTGDGVLSESQERRGIEVDSGGQDKLGITTMQPEEVPAVRKQNNECGTSTTYAKNGTYGRHRARDAGNFGVAQSATVNRKTINKALTSSAAIDQCGSGSVGSGYACEKQPDIIDTVNKAGCSSAAHPLFDYASAANWIYPQSVQHRDYQVNITRTSLFHNTLVCIPTGLGKTVIAAVVMYNYYRWFPDGKLIFAAPTKPLVVQQLKACINIAGLCAHDCAEITGTVGVAMRGELWATRRLYFCTPQTLEKDVAKGLCPCKKFVCIIYDECHRAQDNYAYVTALAQIKRQGAKPRVVGLSATPGKDVNKIQNVINNLSIARIEFRSEHDADVVPYVHKKNTELRIVEPDHALEQITNGVREVLTERQSILCTRKVLHTTDPTKYTRYGLQKLMNIYLEKSRQGYVSKEVIKVFEQAKFLAHLREILEGDSIQTASQYMQANIIKPQISELKQDPVFNTTSTRIQQAQLQQVTHPKLKLLKQVLREHFLKAQSAPVQYDTTRENICDSSASGVIVFTSTRDSVQAIVDALQGDDLIIAKAFIGQGSGSGSGGCSGMRQKEQEQVLGQFRERQFNTMVATCIAEEGLDIPDVDLIVCYDACASPTRSIQRIGRTGRHREGRVVYILHKGKEQERYKLNQRTTSDLHHKLRNIQGNFQMCVKSPRMLPLGVQPAMLVAPLAVDTPYSAAKVRGRVSGIVRSGGLAESGRGRGRGRGRKRKAQVDKSMIEAIGWGSDEDQSKEQHKNSKRRKQMNDEIDDNNAEWYSNVVCTPADCLFTAPCRGVDDDMPKLSTYQGQHGEGNDGRVVDGTNQRFIDQAVGAVVTSVDYSGRQIQVDHGNQRQLGTGFNTSQLSMGQKRVLGNALACGTVDDDDDDDDFDVDDNDSDNDEQQRQLSSFNLIQGPLPAPQPVLRSPEPQIISNNLSDRKHQPKAHNVVKGCNHVNGGGGINQAKLKDLPISALRTPVHFNSGPAIVPHAIQEQHTGIAVKAQGVVHHYSHCNKLTIQKDMGSRQLGNKSINSLTPSLTPANRTAKRADTKHKHPQLQQSLSSKITAGHGHTVNHVQVPLCQGSSSQHMGMGCSSQHMGMGCMDSQLAGETRLRQSCVDKGQQASTKCTYMDHHVDQQIMQMYDHVNLDKNGLVSGNSFVDSKQGKVVNPVTAQNNEVDAIAALNIQVDGQGSGIADKEHGNEEREQAMSIAQIAVDCIDRLKSKNLACIVPPVVQVGNACQFNRVHAKQGHASDEKDLKASINGELQGQNQSCHEICDSDRDGFIEDSSLAVWKENQKIKVNKENGLNYERKRDRSVVTSDSFAINKSVQNNLTQSVEEVLGLHAVLGRLKGQRLKVNGLFVHEYVQQYLQAMEGTVGGSMVIDQLDSIVRDKHGIVCDKNGSALEKYKETRHLEKGCVGQGEANNGKEQSQGEKKQDGADDDCTVVKQVLGLCSYYQKYMVLANTSQNHDKQGEAEHTQCQGDIVPVKQCSANQQYNRLGDIDPVKQCSANQQQIRLGEASNVKQKLRVKKAYTKVIAMYQQIDAMQVTTQLLQNSFIGVNSCKDAHRATLVEQHQAKALDSAVDQAMGYVVSKGKTAAVRHDGSGVCVGKDSEDVGQGGNQPDAISSCQLKGFNPKQEYGKVAQYGKQCIIDRHGEQRGTKDKQLDQGVVNNEVVGNELGKERHQVKSVSNKIGQAVCSSLLPTQHSSAFNVSNTKQGCMHKQAWTYQKLSGRCNVVGFEQQHKNEVELNHNDDQLGECQQREAKSIQQAINQQGNYMNGNIRNARLQVDNSVAFCGGIDSLRNECGAHANVLHGQHDQVQGCLQQNDVKEQAMLCSQSDAESGECANDSEGDPDSAIRGLRNAAGFNLVSIDNWGNCRTEQKGYQEYTADQLGYQGCSTSQTHQDKTSQLLQQPQSPQINQNYQQPTIKKRQTSSKPQGQVDQHQTHLTTDTPITPGSSVKKPATPYSSTPLTTPATSPLVVPCKQQVLLSDCIQGQQQRDCTSSIQQKQQHEIAAHDELAQQHRLVNRGVGLQNKDTENKGGQMFKCQPVVAIGRCGGVLVSQNTTDICTPTPAKHTSPFTLSLGAVALGGINATGRVGDTPYTVQSPKHQQQHYEPNASTLKYCTKEKEMKIGVKMQANKHRVQGSGANTNIYQGTDDCTTPNVLKQPYVTSNKPNDSRVGDTPWTVNSLTNGYDRSVRVCNRTQPTSRTTNRTQCSTGLDDDFDEHSSDQQTEAVVKNLGREFKQCGKQGQCKHGSVNDGNGVHGAALEKKQHGKSNNVRSHRIVDLVGANCEDRVCRLSTEKYGKIRNANGRQFISNKRGKQRRYNLLIDDEAGLGSSGGEYGSDEDSMGTVSSSMKNFIVNTSAKKCSGSVGQGVVTPGDGHMPNSGGVGREYRTPDQTTPAMGAATQQAAYQRSLLTPTPMQREGGVLCRLGEFMRRKRGDGQMEQDTFSVDTCEREGGDDEYDSSFIDDDVDE